MNNNEEKLFSSIGRLEDDILDSALGYKKETSGNKGKVLSIKKLTAIALAALMCIGLVITVSAYGSDIWAAITQRQRELIDDKSQYINESVTADSGITLTIDNIASNGARGFFYFSIHSGKEPFTNGLKYEEFQVYYKTSPELNVTYAEPVKMGDWYLAFAEGDGIHGLLSTVEKIDYDPEKSMTSVQFLLNTPIHSTTYKIVIKGITSEDGTIEYADDMTIEFKVDQSKMENITQLMLFKPSPEIEFELDGSKYQIASINMEPYSLNITLINRDEDVMEYDGSEYYSITRFNSELWMKKDWFDCKKQALMFYYVHPEMYSPEGASDEIMAEYNELEEKASALLQENLIISNIDYDDDGEYHTIILQQEPHSQSYDILVELKPDCGAEVVENPHTNYYNFGIQILNPDTLDPATLEMTMSERKGFEFSSPIYVTDIKRVYITKNSDPDFELTIYEPDKDESLLAYLNGQS